MTAAYKDIFVLLDDNRFSCPSPGEGRGQGRRLLFQNPLRVLTCADYDGLGGFFDQMEEALASGHHLAGWFAYEAGYGLEPKLTPLAPPVGPMPLAWMGVFNGPEISEGPLPAAPEGQEALVDNLAPALAPGRYAKAIAAIQNYLAAGDVYQINFTFPLTFTLTGRPGDLWRRLRRAQPVSYGAHIHTPEWDILSLSPELFFHKDGDSLTARPMKGTARRGATLAEDAAIAAALKADPKSQAENLMIVDLLRNDLSRIARSASVDVPTLFEVEKYRTLIQMTSTVTARVDPSLPLKTLFQSLYPCGSVTGAPKIRAMEIIRELEAAPRGVYTGAIGHISPDRNMTFSVPIRTLTLTPVDPAARRWAGSLGIGGGIVADSTTEAEYDECLLKARFLTLPPPDFELLETLRWEPDGGFQHLDRHLERLAASAAYFDFPYDREAIEHRLWSLAGGLAAAPHRIRLLLSNTGAVAVTATVMTSASGPLTVILSSQRVRSDDPLLRHKTTARVLYDAALREAKAEAAFDALLTNERGEVTEGSFTNVFMEKDGRLLTPPLSSGLLPGVLRQQLLADGRAAEAVLTPADLAAAPRLYVGNSLRGLMAATLPAP